MPTIVKKNVCPVPRFCKEKESAGTVNAGKIYHTSKWRRLRMAKLMQNPVCEKCGKELSEVVHHIISIPRDIYSIKSREIGFNPANVMALCKKCHHEIHNENAKEKGIFFRKNN